MRADVDTLYFSSVATKYEMAHRLYRQKQRDLNGDYDLQKALTDLDNSISLLGQQMATMTMFSQCAECGHKEGGGCCSAFMAGETDGILLLINLLLGVDISFQRDDDFECAYLGKNGCIFKAKPMFCLNYNCRAIYAMNSQREIESLDKAAGRVLRQQYKVERKLLRSLGLQ